jgi:hypothetical protein
MLRLASKVTITQLTDWSPYGTPIQRNSVYEFRFVNNITIESGWDQLTDTAKLIFPRNMYFLNELTGVKENWEGKNFYAGDTIPIIQRGDKIQIELGYTWFDGLKDVTEMHTEFEGFVTRVFNKTPIEVDCEDYMWKLKQIKAPNKTYYEKDWSVETMLQDMLKGTDIDFKVRNSISTKIGDFLSENETVAEVLARLRKDKHLNSYIRRIEKPDGSVKHELRCSGIVYYPEDQRDTENGAERLREWVFDFNKNIISDNLEYKLKEDVNLHIKAYSVNKNELTSTTKTGKTKKTNKRLSVVVPDESIHTGGETKTLYFYDVKTEAELKKLATERLNRIWFTGLRGSFETFGLPSVRHGDRIYCQSRTIKEKSGTYLCKKVVKTFGLNGYRQEPELDMRIDGITDADLNAGL